jgi:hypothetical protein
METLHRAAPCRNVPVTFTLDRMKRDPLTDAAEARNSRLLLGGLLLFYGIPILGLIVAYGVGAPNAGFLLGSYLMLAIPAGIGLAIVGGIIFMVRDSQSARMRRDAKINQDAHGTGDASFFPRVFWVIWLVTTVVVVGLFAFMRLLHAA